MTTAPIPSSPLYAQINFVGSNVQTAVVAGVTNEMLLLGIASLAAQLVVRTNMSTGNILPPQAVLEGVLQRLREITPQCMSTVRQEQVPQEPGKAP
jgi:hypothetical protein